MMFGTLASVWLDVYVAWMVDVLQTVSTKASAAA
jgi:hypothetical protein